MFKAVQRNAAANILDDFKNFAELNADNLNTVRESIADVLQPMIHNVGDVSVAGKELPDLLKYLPYTVDHSLAAHRCNEALNNANQHLQAEQNIHLYQSQKFLSGFFRTIFLSPKPALTSREWGKIRKNKSFKLFQNYCAFIIDFFKDDLNLLLPNVSVGVK